MKGINNGNYKTHDFFCPEITPILKGIAIIFMFGLHLLRPEWMSYPELVISLPVKDSYLYAILSNGGDICIGIFAFITGYGWAFSFYKIPRLRRIGGVYKTYWFVLFAFAFPVRYIFQRLIDNTSIVFGFRQALMSLLAINSESVRFQWYIYFFALAVVTYGFLTKLVDRIKMGAIIKSYLICVIFMVARVSFRIVFTKLISSNLMLGIASHYCQWMPVVIMGHIISKERIFDKIKKWSGEKMSDGWFSLLCLLASMSIYCGKCFVQFFTGIYSNYDSFIILPFVFCLCGVANYIHQYISSVKYVLSFLGSISMFLWLSHNILLYQQLQKVLLMPRFPVLILVMAFLIMTPIGYILSKAHDLLFKRPLKLHH